MHTKLPQSFPLARVLRVAALGMLCSFTVAQTPAADWKDVEAAMGRSWQIQPGEVLRFGMPRKDMHIVLSGVEIKPTSSLPFSDITVMFRPDPWKIGPSGYIPVTLAPMK